MQLILFTLLCGLLLTTIVSSQTCSSVTYLYADNDLQYFDSHPFYDIFPYNPNEYNCWVIEAPVGDNVFLKTEEIDLETGCTEFSRDRIKIYDGEDYYSSLYDYWCGSEEVSDYHTTGRYAYVEFVTDGSVQGKGFQMIYWSEEAEDGSDVGAIVGIVIGVLLGLALIVGLIVVCVVCCKVNKSNKGKVHSTTPQAQPTAMGYQARGQVYPTQQFATASYAGGAVVVTTGQANIKLPPLQGPIGHPVDSNGVPMPAIYIEPRNTGKI